MSIVAAKLQDFLPLPEGKAQYSISFIRSRRALVLGRLEPGGNTPPALLVGVCSSEPELLDYLTVCHRSFMKATPHFMLLQKDDFELQLSRMETAELMADLSSRSLGDGRRGSRVSENASGSRLESRSSAAGPVARILDNILLECIHNRIQDIHLEPGENGGRIRIRRGSGWEIFRSYESFLFAALIRRIRILARLRQMDVQGPQDGSFLFEPGKEGDGNTGHRIRVSLLSEIHGESASLRLLLPAELLPEPELLGYRTSTLEFIFRCLQGGHGLLLFCGPTGAGKTTSLHSIAARMAGPERKIISIEDPVEICNPAIEQIELREDLGVGISNVMKNVLRRRPDILIVGEIRDRASAELAIRAALSGHMVLSSLHCGECREAFPRLMSLGISPELQSAAIRGIISQRLVQGPAPDSAYYLRENLLVMTPQLGDELIAVHGEGTHHVHF